MIKGQTFRRALFVGLLALLIVGPASLLISPQADAIGCPGNVHSPVEHEWVLTEAARERTESGLYCNTAKPICREECLTTCGETLPLNIFDCFAN